MLTRLAPSPTGALHLGNARTFLINWLLARQNGWRVMLRIDDLDGPRIKAGADRLAIEDLQWLGLDWDTGPIYQSAHQPRYADAVAKLLSAKQAYPCVCTRKDVEQSASAPHADDGSAVYPGTCRGKFASVDEAAHAAGRPPVVRFSVRPGIVRFADDFRGQQAIDVAKELGDFVVAKADGTPAYQLATVVDDADAGVTHVVRGDDLLDSTPRQILLYQTLGLEGHIPRYYHLPLVVGTDGRRLAKRHGDSRLASYRQAGVTPSRLRALLARWMNIPIVQKKVTMGELLEKFSLDALSRRPIVFSATDHQWLLE